MKFLKGPGKFIFFFFLLKTTNFDTFAYEKNYFRVFYLKNIEFTLGSKEIKFSPYLRFLLQQINIRGFLTKDSAPHEIFC